MKHKGIRITLVVIELFVGLWAVIGGVGLVTGAIPFLQMPIEYLQGTPFSDYTIPGLLLLLVVGGSCDWFRGRRGPDYRPLCQYSCHCCAATNYHDRARSGVLRTGHVPLAD